MKNIFILSMLFMSLSFYGQTVMVSGKVYIGSGNNLPNAIKSENYVIVAIRPQSNTVSFSVNGDVQNCRILSSNLTAGGSARKYILSDGLKLTIALMTNIDVVIFPWDPSDGTVGFIKVKLTADDKMLLGLNKY